MEVVLVNVANAAQAQLKDLSALISQLSFEGEFEKTLDAISVLQTALTSEFDLLTSHGRKRPLEQAGRSLTREKAHVSDLKASLEMQQRPNIADRIKNSWFVKVALAAPSVVARTLSQWCRDRPQDILLKMKTGLKQDYSAYAMIKLVMMFAKCSACANKLINQAMIHLAYIILAAVVAAVAAACALWPGTAAYPFVGLAPAGLVAAVFVTKRQSRKDVLAEAAKVAERQDILDKVAAAHVMREEAVKTAAEDENKWKETLANRTFYYGEHVGVTCDACATFPVFGYRYLCKKCADHSICESCYDAWAGGTGVMPNGRAKNTLSTNAADHSFEMHKDKTFKPFVKVRHSSDSASATTKAPKTKPNDACSCGSGKKYKKCCMNN